MAGAKAMANMLSDQEEFNTHYASLKGWEEAVRRQISMQKRHVAPVTPATVIGTVEAGPSPPKRWLHTEVEKLMKRCRYISRSLSASNAPSG
jgi:hypothetical protein